MLARSSPLRIGALVCALAACTPGDPKTAPDATISVDAALEPDGDGPGPRLDEGVSVDAAPDAAPDLGLDARPPDAAPDGQAPDGQAPDGQAPDATRDAVATDASDADADATDAPDAAPDAALPPPVPEWRHVALAAGGERAWVAWPTRSQLVVRELGPDATFTGPARPMAELLAPPAGLAGIVFDGVPWIAFALAPDAPVILVRPDEPAAPPLVLEVRGAPLLARLGPAMLVVGRDAAGERAAWQLVEPAGEVWAPLPAQLAPMPGPPADDAAGLDHGALLRFEADGQCLQLDLEGRAIGALPCVAAPGRLFGSGRRAFVVHENRTQISDVRVTPLFGRPPARPERIGLVGAAERAHYPPTDVGQPVVATAENQHFLAIVGPGGWSRTTDAYPVWPYEDARAAVPRAGAVHLLRFGTPDDPAITSLPIQPGDGAADYGNLLDDACVAPRNELCDLLDDDCDLRAEDGLCCRDPELLEGLVAYDGFPTELLVSDVYTAAGVRFAIRSAAGRWRGFRAIYPLPPERPFRLLEIPQFAFEGGPGVALTTLGEYSLLLTDAAVGVRATWHHEFVALATLKPPTDLDCDFRATDWLGRGDNASPVLVVCRDRLLRLTPLPGNADETLVDGLPASIDWATIGPVEPDGARPVLLGFTGEFTAIPAVRLIRVPASGPAVELPLPAALAAVPRADLTHPLWLLPPPQVGQPEPIFQEGPAGPRLWRAGEDGLLAWRSIRTGREPGKNRIARGQRRVVSAGPVTTAEGERLAFWPLDVSGYTRPALWPIEPAFTVPDPGALWGTHNGRYGRELFVLAREAGSAQPRAYIPRFNCQ